ncbi:MAG: hypothetical protein KDK51_09930, partial [Deltaproteobacteria bacterium]|nr:hypothetical protein [Deltaproteobacteria bacterium]
MSLKNILRPAVFFSLFFVTICGFSIKVHAQTVEDVFIEFSHGQLPDISDPNQVALFNAYISSAFPYDERTNIKNIANIIEILNANPSLSKDDFSRYLTETQQVIYNSHDDITSVFKQLRDLSVKLQTLHDGYDVWKDVEHLENLWILAYKLATGTVENDIQKIQEWVNQYSNRQAWWTGLGKALKTNLESTGNEKLFLYLAHTWGVINEDLVEKYKISDGLQKMTILNSILNDYPEEFFQEVEYEYKKNYNNFLSEAKKKIKDVKPKIQVKETRTKTSILRALSILEGPFRGGLGDDCSSETYLDRALEQGFIYFTTTKSDGSSEGHLTIVLGTAKDSSGQTVKVAMVDKIQGYDNAALPVIIEATRRSLSKHGYRLAIPTDLGDHNGISNLETTQEYIETELKAYTNSKETVANFTPIQSSYIPDRTQGYSRAEDKLELKVIEPYTPTQQEKIEPLSARTPPFIVSEINSSKVLKNTFNFKEGTQEEKLKYIKIMTIFKQQDLTALLDPVVDESIEKLLFVDNQKIKSAAIRYFLSFNEGLYRASDIFIRSYEDGNKEFTIAFIQTLQNVLQREKYISNGYEVLQEIFYIIKKEFYQESYGKKWLKMVINLKTLSSHKNYNLDITLRDALIQDLLFSLPEVKNDNGEVRGQYSVFEYLSDGSVQDSKKKQTFQSLANILQYGNLDGNTSAEKYQSLISIFLANTPMSVPMERDWSGTLQAIVDGYKKGDYSLEEFKKKMEAYGKEFEKIDKNAARMLKGASSNILRSYERLLESIKEQLFLEIFELEQKRILSPNQTNESYLRFLPRFGAENQFLKNAIDQIVTENISNLFFDIASSSSQDESIKYNINIMMKELAKDHELYEKVRIAIFLKPQVDQKKGKMKDGTRYSKGYEYYSAPSLEEFLKIDAKIVREYIEALSFRDQEIVLEILESIYEDAKRKELAP